MSGELLNIGVTDRRYMVRVNLGDTQLEKVRTRVELPHDDEPVLRDSMMAINEYMRAAVHE